MGEKKINLILLGPPGAGKRTQAKKLAQKYKLLHFSATDAVKKEIEKGNPVALEAQPFIKKGEITPVSIILHVLDLWLEANPQVNGFILDRFPDDLAECKALDEYLEEKGEAISKLIQFELEEQTLLKRQPNLGPVAHLMRKEGLQKFHRLLESYKKDSLLIYNHYAAYGRAAKVLGEGSVDRVFANLCSVVDKLV
jgi:adenylate kinase